MFSASLKPRSLASARPAWICAIALALLGVAVAPAHAQTETFKVGTFTKAAGVAVAHQISASNATNSALTLSITGFIPGAGANRLLVVGLSSSNTLTGITVSFAGNALTAVPASTSTNTVRTQFFYLVNPPSASGTVTATWTTTARALVMGATVFNNVDQTTPFQNVITATGTSTTPSIAVATTGGNATMAIAAKTTNLGTTTTQDQRWLNTSVANIKGFGSTQETAAGTTSTTHSINAAATSSIWAMSGLDIRQAAQPQTVAHGLGQAPSALLLWTTGSTAAGFNNSEWSALGMTDGTTSFATARTAANAFAGSNTSRRAAAKAITLVDGGQVLLAEADLGSWDATNFILSWTNNANATAYTIHFLAIGGVAAKVLQWTPTAGTGNKAITGVGFQPNVVFHMGDQDNAALPSSIQDAAFGFGVMDADGNQWVSSIYSDDAIATTDTWRAQRTDACIQELSNTGANLTRANWVSMDANGFTVNYSTNGAQNKMYSLALAGLNLHVGSFNKTTGPATPTFVQQASKNAGAVSVATQAFPGVSTTGNLIVVTVTHQGTAAVSSITDTKGNTYNLAISTDVSATYHASTYYASNIVGGGAAITITVNFSAATTASEVFQLEYSGVQGDNPLDQVSSNFGTTVSPMNSGAKTTTQVNELIYGFGGTTTGGVTSGGTFTTRANADTQAAADKTVASIGSYSYDATFAGTRTWVAHMATFKGGQSQSGLGFTPAAVFFASVMDITRTVAVAESRIGFGASDGTTEFTSSMQDQDAVTTSRVRNFERSTKAFSKVNNNTSTVDAEANVLGFNTDGFALNWTTNDAVATEILYVAFAPLWLSEVRLIPASFQATRYPSGVLVAWKTGYEVDNLGFDLYRDLNGDRIKVNTAPIKGTGLQAGNGGIVNSEHSYARWDMDADGADPNVVYWLEDIAFDGKRTLHGPITPVNGALEEPAIDDSDEIGDPYDATIGRRAFITYNDDSAASGAAAAQVQPAMAKQWSLAGQPTVKIGIRKPGWYRITQPELVAAGLDAGADPQTLKLFVNGSEVAIKVNGESDGSFDAGDWIEFYGTGVDTSHTDTRVYWLQAGGEPGQRIAAAAPGPFTATSSTGYSSALKRKDRGTYFAALRNGDAENWFGATVYPQPAVSDPDDPFVPAELSITPLNIDRSAAGTADLTIALQAVTNSADGEEEHRVGVIVNGNAVGEMTFTGQNRAEQTFPVALTTLLDGENTVTLEARASANDTSLVDSIKLTYPHTYEADADRLRFSVEGPAAVTIGGFAGTNIRVVDITDRAAPVELAVSVSGGGGLSSVTAQVAGSGPRSLMAFSNETVGTPEFVLANQVSTLHLDTNAHDYVVVSHRDFINEVAPLAAHRQQQGHLAVVVDIEDVYDEFSFGEKTPQALREFLQWASNSWATAPKFVVLAGDATIDPRDYEGLGNADFVPTRQVPMNQATLETASDDWFVDFSDNGLPEIAIGRLSVRTPQQAAEVVSKIIGYDSVGAQAWTRDVLLVADVNDNTANFENQSNALEATLPAGYQAQKAYRGPLGDSATHQAILDGANAGKLIVNFSGHGSTRIWGLNGTMLQNEDVANWANAGKLPFVVAMNCLNGLFNQIFDEDSLGEALLRAPNGGAVAVWASSGLTPPTTQALVNQELFRLIFSGTYSTVGEAVARAKQVVANQDVRRSWVFFGDPAMRLSGAPQPLTTDRPVITLQPQGAAVASGQQPTLTVAASGTAPFTYQWFAGSSGVTTEPIAGAVASSFTTPPVTNGVSYWARVSNPYGHADSAAAAFSVPLAITTPNPLPDMFVGDTYSMTLTTTDGTAPYQWQATNLPVGLSVNPATGDLVGTPTSAGTYSVLVHVTDAASHSAQQTLTLTVRPPRLATARRASDYDGDGRSDLIVYRPSTGTWYVNQSNGAPAAYQWGVAGDVPVAGDYDGDRLNDVAVYRPSTGVWYILQSSTQFTTYFAQVWGTPNDVPVPGDYDGDGKTDPAIYRPGSGVWYVKRSSTNYTTYGVHQWGVAGDVPAPGDYDGDGRNDPAVYRPSTGRWLVLQSSSNYTAQFQQQWGLANDVPVPGDYDGDHKSDLAIYRPSTGVWYVKLSGTNYSTFLVRQWGVDADVAVTGDYDGDGADDVVAYRPSTGFWFILQSSSGYETYSATQWGVGGDVPVVERR